MKRRFFLFIFLLIFLIIPSIIKGAPFLACDPYVSINGETIENVNIRYTPPGEAAVIVGGSYIVSETYANTIILLDLADYPAYVQNISYFRAQWQDSNGRWSEWSVSKGSGIITPSKGSGTIAPGKGVGTISPYYDDILFYLEETDRSDLLFSPIYGIMNLTNTRMMR